MTNRYLPWWVTALFLCIVAGVLTFGFWFYRDQQHRLHEEAVEDLQGIAELKVEQITQWRSERLANAEILSHSPLFIDGVARWLETRNSAHATPLLERFRAYRDFYAYENVLLVDPENRIILFSGEASELHPAVLPYIAQARDQHRAIFSEFYRATDSDVLRLDVISPLYHGSGADARYLGAVLLQTDAQRYIYPLIQSWPTASRSAETLLVRRDGNDALFLNEVRHQRGTALTMRIPLTQTNVPAVMAVLGRRGVFSGNDYRGVPVLSLLEPIPGSPWFMVAKVDEAEVFAESRARARLILGLIVLMLLLIGATFVAFWQSARRQYYRAQSKSLAALQQSEELYRTTLMSIGDGVIVTDNQGCVTMINGVAEAMTGWKWKDALGQKLEEIFHIVSEETNAPVDNPVHRVLQEGAVVGLANHTLLIARDGTARPIADSGAPISTEDGGMHGVVLVFSDQSEMRAAQATLEESEQRYRQLFTSMQEGFALHEIILDAQGQPVDYRFIAVNPAFEQLVGKSAKEIIGHTVLEIFPNTEPYWIERYGKVALTGVPDHFSNYSQALDRWYAVAASSPASRQFMVHFADITERQRAAEALRASEERFRTVVEAAPRAIFIETHGQFAYVNAATCRLFGIDQPEELLGRPVLDFFHPDDQPRIRERMRQLNEERIALPQHEETIISSDGSLVIVEVAAVPFTFEKEPGALFFLHDITLRKHSATRIGHLNQVLRAIRDVNQLIVHERDSRVLIQQACDLFVQDRGFTAAMIVLVDKSEYPTHYAQSGMGDHFAPLAAELEQGMLPPCCTQSMLEPGVHYLDEPAMLCKVCPSHASCLPYDNLCIQLSHDGLRYGFLSVAVEHGIGADQEEQSLFEEIAGDLAYALHAIAQDEAVKTGVLELERINEELRQSQKMEVVGRLAGGIAHDFNNILTGMLGFLDMALLEIAPDVPAHADLQEVRRLSLRAADLTRQLLAFSRRQTLEIEVFNVNRLVENIGKMLRRLLGENIDLQCVLSPLVGNIKADPGQIEQIIVNLALNARDAMPTGGRLTIETANVVYHPENNREHVDLGSGEYVMLAMTDSGSGMDAETKEHIFEPFFTTKGSGKGTGLGLATVYGIVKQHQGAIYVYSEPDLGTTFKIYLPQVHEDEDTSAIAVESIAPAFGDETILLVEDESAVRNIAERVLRELGYTVFSAHNSEEAERLFLAHEGDIDLLLTDVVMPGINGLELYRRLSARAPGLKVLYTSGYTPNAIVHHGILDEGVSLLQKPFTLESIAGKVRQILDE